MTSPGYTDGTDVLRAIRRARAVAEDHMSRADRAGLAWREETISELLWVHADPFVRCADFTRHEENQVGADWLWWWVDERGEAFGMLVQAKRMKLSKGGAAELDFNHNKGQQMAHLLKAAERLGVPAMYALYFGGTEHRGGLTCSSAARHDASGCRRCDRASVSMLPGLMAPQAAGGSRRDAADQAFRWSVALEDLVDYTPTGRGLLALRIAGADPELLEFLRQPQHGARHVAQKVLDMVLRLRTGQFSSTMVDGEVRLGEDPVFPVLPADAGHFGQPYFLFVLQGLRSRPPSYVEDVLADQLVPAAVSQLARGVIVVRC